MRKLSFIIYSVFYFLSGVLSVVHAEEAISPLLDNNSQIVSSIRGSFWLDQIPWLEVKFQDTPLWQYLAFFIFLIIAYFVTKLLSAILFSFAKKWLPSADNSLGKRVLSLMCRPARLIIFVTFLYIGLELYKWPTWVADILYKLFKLSVALSATYAFAKLVDIIFLTWREKTHGDKTFSEQVIPLLNSAVKYVVVFIGILTMASNLGVDITSILTLGSVGALAVSLAAQDLLSNIFGGIAILMDKPFVIGDVVKVESRYGTVETIGLRSTRIRTFDGFLVTIPNKSMANSTIDNVTSRPTIKTEINVGVTYDTTTEQLRKALDIANNVYANHPNTKDTVVSFNKFGDFALNIQIVHWHIPAAWAVYVKDIEEMNLELKKRYDSEGIGFAFPTQTVYLKQE